MTNFAAAGICAIFCALLQKTAVGFGDPMHTEATLRAASHRTGLAAFSFVIKVLVTRWESASSAGFRFGCPVRQPVESPPVWRREVVLKPQLEFIK